MMYFGMKFKNREELRAWTKAGKISEYKKLSVMFFNNPTMEVSVMMSDLSLILHDDFGMSFEEIESIELEAMVA